MQILDFGFEICVQVSMCQDMSWCKFWILYSRSMVRRDHVWGCELVKILDFVFQIFGQVRMWADTNFGCISDIWLGKHVWGSKLMQILDSRSVGICACVRMWAGVNFGFWIPESDLWVGEHVWGCEQVQIEGLPPPSIFAMSKCTEQSLVKGGLYLMGKQLFGYSILADSSR